MQCRPIINARGNAMTADTLMGHFKNDHKECSSMFQRETKKGICLFGSDDRWKNDECGMAI
jgi:hypothetical protein